MIPFPPREIGLVYTPDEKNNISLASEFAIYNPELPLGMRFPGPQFCDGSGQRLLVVGTVPPDSKANLSLSQHSQLVKAPFPS